MENKLTISHLAPYLPYGLEAVNLFNETVKIVGLQKGNEAVSNELWVFKKDNRWVSGYLYECKPILRPLQQFTSINSPAMSELNCDLDDQIQITDLADARRSYYSLSWSAMEACFRNHVDVFDLIGKGLAIEKGARA